MKNSCNNIHPSLKQIFLTPQLDIDLICKEIGMSRSNFYRKAKTLTNLSPAEMIKNFAWKQPPKCFGKRI